MSQFPERHDVIVIGAGVGGIYQIKRLTDLGIDAILLEGDEDLGGTWYRNRYPGCRFDSESYTYGYSFSKRLVFNKVKEALGLTECKYIKDLDFQIPNAKVFFSLSKDISSYKINIDIKSNQIKQNIIEVLTSLNLKPKNESIDKINTKIVLATIIEMDSQKIEKTEIEKIVLIDVPSQIYGEIRKIFISLFESSGFKDIKINEKVDFKKLYDLKKSQ